MKFLIRTRNIKRTTQWNVFFHYSTVFYNIITGIFLVPIYLQFIPSDLYGSWLASGNILGWISMVDPGFSSVLHQRIAYAYGQKDIGTVGQLIGIVFKISIYLFIVLFLICFFLMFFISGWVKINPLFTKTFEISFLFSAIGTIATILSFNVTAVNQGLQSSLGIGLVYAFSNLSAIVIIVCMFYLGFGLIAIGIGNLYRGLVMFLGTFFYCYFRLKVEEIVVIKASSLLTKDLYKNFSLNFLGKISGLVKGQINFFLVAQYVAPSSVPILKFSQTAFDISSIILIRPAMALSSSLSLLYGAGDHNRIRILTLRYFLITIWLIGLSITGIIGFNSTFVSIWVGHQYYGGSYLNYLLCVNLICSVYYEILQTLNFYSGNIKGSNFMALGQFVSWLLLFYFFINGGIEGFIILSVLSYCVFSIIYGSVIFFKKMNYGFFEKKKLILNVLVTLLSSVSTLLMVEALKNQISIFTIPFIIFGGVLSQIYLFSRSFRFELNTIIKYLLSKFTSLEL